MLNYAIYNGVDSRDFGLYIVDKGGSPQVLNIAPSKLTRSGRVAGRDSSYVWEQNYNSRTISILFYSNRKDDDITKLISRWLGVKGNKTLILSYEPYKVYSATIEGQLSMTTYNKNHQGYLEVNFICYDPIAYSGISTLNMGGIEYNTGLFYNSGLIYADLLSNDYSFVGGDLPNLDIYHGGNADLATPVITIIGSATDITIGHYRDSARTDLITECAYGAFSGTLIVDSLLMDTFLNSSVTVLESGDYFKLLGKGDLSRNAFGELININESQITLDSNASAVDDFYNGEVIAIGFDDKIEYRSVLDYDGTTKIATIDTPFSFKSEVCKFYSIFDLSDGINFIKITGTGLSITSVDVNFKFTFL